jgi:hypothetical protein
MFNAGHEIVSILNRIFLPGGSQGASRAATPGFTRGQFLMIEPENVR